MEIEKYFQLLESELKRQYNIAQNARSKGLDPVPYVETPIAKNMAEKVIGLVASKTPIIFNIKEKLIKRLAELESKFGFLDWRVALTIAEELAKGRFCQFKNKIEAMETGIRVGFAYLTLGTVASPLEGFIKLEVRKRADKKEYIAAFYSGPIRSAGGTAASVSVIIADYLRMKLGFASYDPTQLECKRAVTELYDYHERVTNLQYLPSEEEISFLYKNLPIQIEGDPTQQIEVSNYKDLKRINTNRIRGGFCLVIGECLCQKAAKLWKNLSKWGAEFNLEHWSFLKQFLKIQKKAKAKGAASINQISPNYTYIADLVAGRPVLGFPMKPGGFRLRYGRCRCSGLSSCSIHPATMRILQGYLATGTQIRIERPSKATAITACDTIEGPIVRLKDGSVIAVSTDSEAKKIFHRIDKILFLGDLLVSYGDFFNRAHPLVPAGYCEEWWAAELRKVSLSCISSERYQELINLEKPTPDEAIAISKECAVPLHPAYTYFWKLLTKDDLLAIAKDIESARIEHSGGKISKAIIPISKSKEALEKAGIPHLCVANEWVVIERPHIQILLKILPKAANIATSKKENALEIINEFSKIKVRDKCGTFIGARMGRPEKAKIRKLATSPHTLFPVGEQGGRLRSIQSALEAGKIIAEFPLFQCPQCRRSTPFPVCICGKKTQRKYLCPRCGPIDTKECPKHGQTKAAWQQIFAIEEEYKATIDKLKIKPNFIVKGVRGTSNKEHIPEHFAKGILRAVHNLYVNRDGTIRYDMTQLGITHFRPKEIGTSVQKLRELGYTKDIYGKPLESEEQLLELLPQDVILPACPDSPDEGTDSILLRITQFIDALLVRFYGLKPFYKCKTHSDLPGILIAALAPHTSAAILGRVIGFSKTQGFFAHPLFHAAQRRDLDGDETSITILLDLFLNFSKSFLPAHRGASQDTPLILASRLIPTEVDDMVFDMDIASSYPIELYEKALHFAMPWEVKVEQVGSRLSEQDQRRYSGYGFTHDTSDINIGPRCSAYKTLPTMEEKLKGQMVLAEQIAAVDEAKVASLVIQKHFLPDIRGNLRKFSTQKFRCVKCNEKFRRPPLIGRCPKCGGRIIFTVSEGTIIKYLEPTLSLAERYSVPTYLKQTLELLKKRIESIFGKEKQESLKKWFS